MSADVVATRSPAKLQRELVVGFDPVALYAAALEQRFGLLASFFWDGCGGRAIAIKWRSAALQTVIVFSLAVAPDAHADKPPNHFTILQP